MNKERRLERRLIYEKVENETEAEFMREKKRQVETGAKCSSGGSSGRAGNGED